MLCLFCLFCIYLVASCHHRAITCVFLSCNREPKLCSLFLVRQFCSTIVGSLLAIATLVYKNTSAYGKKKKAKITYYILLSLFNIFYIKLNNILLLDIIVGKFDIKLLFI